MARNRKAQSAAIRFGPALKAFLLCLLIGGSGVGYVWQKEQIAKLGQKKKERELQLRSLARLNDGLRKQLANLSSPVSLKAQAAKLGLVQPEESQFLRLTEPMPEQTRPQAEARYAASNNHAPFGQ